MWTRRRRSTKVTNPKNAQWRRHACSAELVTTLLLESIRHELSDSHYDMEHNKQSKFYLIWNQHFFTLGNSILFYKSRSSRWLIELLIDWLIDWFRTNLCSSFFTLLPLVPHIRLKWKFTGEWEWGFGHTIHTITLVSAMLCSLMHKEIEIGTKNIFRCLNLRYLFYICCGVITYVVSLDVKMYSGQNRYIYPLRFVLRIIYIPNPIYYLSDLFKTWDYGG